MSDMMFYNVWRTETRDNQQRLLAAMREEASKLAAKPGFRSLVVHEGEDGRVLVEGCWESREAFDAAVTEDHDAKASRQVLQAYGTAEPGIFTESFRIGPKNALTPADPRAAAEDGQRQVEATAVIRVSRADFDPRRFSEVDRMTRETGSYLMPAIKRLPGLVAYFVGTSPNGSAVHVSVWESDAHAHQMNELKEMVVDARRDAQAVGAQFQPIAHYPVAWDISREPARHRVRGAT